MSGMQDLCNTIQRLMRRDKRTSTTVKVGTLSGTQVLVDGRYYPAEWAVDADVDDGQAVYVIISEDGAKAVIVGN